MFMKCEECYYHSLPVISENGLHYNCCLSARSAKNCLFGKKDCFVDRHSTQLQKGMKHDVLIREIVLDDDIIEEYDLLR